MSWKPSPDQISLAIDCATARVSIGSAAALLGISPRTMRSFLRRLEKARAQKAISQTWEAPRRLKCPQARAMGKLISVRQALQDPCVARQHAWRQVLCRHAGALDRRHGRGADGGRNAHIEPLTGRAETPGEAVEELWVIAGRRSGKTRAIGTLAAYLAGCCDYRDCLGPGERGVLPIMAANTLQAGQCLNFIKGIFTGIPRFAALVESLGGRNAGITSDTISLRDRIDIQVRPANFRTIRGITAIGVIAEECSMWQSDDSAQSRS